jgi:hypothetical protein
VLAAVSLLVALGAACSVPAGAVAKPGLTTGFADPDYFSANAERRDFAFSRTAAEGASIVRLNLSWRAITTGQPVDPRNPGDPAYSFGSLDTAVRGAVAAGLQPMVTVVHAPDWAEGPGRPAGVPAGTWRPRPNAVADFGHALATRYSGGFSGSGGVLPRVRLYQFWNEPNLPTYLTPQYENGAGASPSIYREMLNAFYGEVKAVSADNVVITAGTAPYGDPPGGNRFRPLAFWREVLCVKGKRKPKPAACTVKADFDVLAHHPINTSGGPDRSAINHDDISTPDLDDLHSVLRAAERGHRTGTSGRHPIWATEIWWDTDPPNRFGGLPPKRQARWLEQAMYEVWRDGARVLINLRLRDSDAAASSPFGAEASGVYFADGSAKPSATAWRFPLISAKTKKRKKIVVWGRAPVGGKVKIQGRRGGGWKRVASVQVKAGSVFQRKLALPKGTKLRASVGGERSLVWGGA